MKVFDAAYADSYDALYAEKNYEQECDLIDEAVRKHGGKGGRALLDVGCGTGGHAWELSRRGYLVTGVDLSAAMLEVAMAKPSPTGMQSRPHFFQGDARNFDSGKEHDTAIMMFAVIGYMVGNADVMAALRNVRRQLRHGGLFVCDFWYGPAVLSVRPGDRVRVMDTGAGRIIRSASTILDTEAHTADVSFRLWSIAADRLVSETTETHRMRYFFPQEMRLFLDSAGFEVLSMTAFPSLDEPLSDQRWNSLVVARAV
jgi:SAM-dependent methyltransferase